MKFATVSPPAPPREIAMTFSRHEGWAVVAALRAYAEMHPDAADVREWRAWAEQLDKELRRD